MLLLWLPALPPAYFYEAAPADDGWASDRSSMISLGQPDAQELNDEGVTVCWGRGVSMFGSSRQVQFSSDRKHGFMRWRYNPLLRARLTSQFINL